MHADHGDLLLARGRRTLVAVVVLSLVAFALAATALAGSPPARAASVAKTALINGDSVTTSDGILDSGGNPISLEQYAAQAAGYTVTVVDGATWDAMTTAQFASYQVLIAGDPLCGITPASTNSNAPVWAAAVMNTTHLNTQVGNRTVVGTDPEYHYAFGAGGAAPTDPTNPQTAGAEHLVQDGIAYAGGVAGATGIYYDTSCEDPASAGDSDIATLNLLTAASPNWTEDTNPPCGGSVAIVAANPVFSTAPTALTQNDIQGWGCSVHLTYPTFPSDFTALAVATDTATTPTCGTDPSTGGTACGEAYVILAGSGIVATAPDLALSPLTNTDPAGPANTHTVAATVTSSGSPVAGQAVSFAVSGGPNAGVTGSCSFTGGGADPGCVTDAAGVVDFTYADTGGAGTDTILASITVSGSTQTATASETWSPVTGGSNCQVTGGTTARPLTDTVTHKTVLAEYTLNSDLSRTEHLVVRNTPQTFFFTATSTTSATCVDFTSAPLPAGHRFNYLYASGTGTYGKSATTGLPGFTWRVEIHIPINAAGQTTMTLVVRNAGGSIVKRVAGTFLTPGTETEY